MSLSKEKIEDIREEEQVRAEAKKEFSRTAIPTEGFQSVVRLKSSLSTEQLAMLQSEFDKNKRSTGIAYLLLFLFVGAVGAHKFYLKQKNLGILYILLLVPGFLFWGVPPLILGIFLLFDIFTLPRQVREANEKIEAEKIKELFPTLYLKLSPAITNQEKRKGVASSLNFRKHPVWATFIGLIILFIVVLLIVAFVGASK